MITIAALFVEEKPGSAYVDVPGVEVWGISRDARLYPGPHPVVCHSPCARWGRYWFGGPSVNVRKVAGDDDGCFASALKSVRTWGGVLEHPEASKAWRAHQLIVPLRGGGWSVADDRGGWTCCVEQGAYGHRARKATWLYAFGVELPVLKWGRSSKVIRLDYGFHSAEERRKFTRPPAGLDDDSRAARHVWLDWYEAQSGKTWCAPERMGKRERMATPLPFRDLLLEMARTVKS